MDYFAYKNGELWCEDARVSELAQLHGTPLYVYSARTMREHFTRIREAFSAPVCSSPRSPAAGQDGVASDASGTGVPPVKNHGQDAHATPREVLVCYSVKANSNLAILDLLRRAGAGFDVVSGGELFRALRVGANPRKIVFAGVGKTDDEIALGLDAGILMFNVESEAELDNMERLARAKGKIVPVALRLNPDVDPQTHKYITTGKHENKFGIDLLTAKKLVENWNTRRAVRLVGLHVHIGSQLLSAEPYVAALKKVGDFADFCRNHVGAVEWLDMGGGFGVFYKEREALSAKDFADAVLPIADQIAGKLLLEPGRFVVGNAGILLTKVLYMKSSGERVFVICDSGMNDLIRPSLYGAFHRIWPVRANAPLPAHAAGKGKKPRPDAKDGIVADVVGPVCESGDFFAKERALPPVSSGDLLAVFSAGAYGCSMASNYNSRPRPAEVLVSGAEHKLISRRETYEDLVQREVM